MSVVYVSYIVPGGDAVMGKPAGICAAVVGGVERAWLGLTCGGVRSKVVRSPVDDLFR